jgi:hypothetical protein
MKEQAVVGPRRIVVRLSDDRSEVSVELWSRFDCDGALRLGLAEAAALLELLKTVLPHAGVET